MTIRSLIRLLTTCALVAACAKDTPAGLKPDSSSTKPSATPNFAVGFPQGWSGTGGNAYQIGLTTAAHGGKAALAVISTTNATTTGVVAQGIRADAYRGKRVRFSAVAKPVGVSAAFAGLWMRVDGPGMTLAFDNMKSRPLVGTADWQDISIVPDVANTALGVTAGVLMRGMGTIVLDDIRLEVVGPDVPSTDDGTSPQPNGADSSTIAASYARTGTSMVNLDFEGVPDISQPTVDWLRQRLVPLNTTDPDGAADGLSAISAMVGDAHVVGLGEATHGSREFFRMKHRILESLVKEQGFTYFAMEATSPESDDMNRYVLTGGADAQALLSRLYFWTWNTEEVLAMVQWMREWNISAPTSRRVQFLGFDMQYPGAAMDTVAAFTARVDPGRAPFVAARYACLARFRNVQQHAGQPTTVYAAQDILTKVTCARGLTEVHDSIDARRLRYQQIVGDSTVESVVHAARLVQQFEAMAAVANDASASSLVRDRAMAENVGWIRSRMPAGAKLVLWAHNFHIGAMPGTMGSFLRASYGSDYRALGFLFRDGSFNAYGTDKPLQAWTTSQAPAGALELVFERTNVPIALFDTRTIAAGGSVADPLAGPIRMRSIGAVFDPTAELAYFGNQLFPNDFDLLVFIKSVTPSRLLPFF